MKNINNSINFAFDPQQSRCSFGIRASGSNSWNNQESQEMPKSRRNDPPKEGYQQLDIAAINDKLDKQFNQLEEMLGEMLEEMFKEMTKEMTKTLVDAISGEQQETTSSGSQKLQGEKQEAELEQQDVDEGSDKEEGDSNGEVGFADSVEEQLGTGKDKKEDKESKKGQEVEEDRKVNATKVAAAAKPKKEEKKEAKASTSNADKEKKKPAANKEEKEKVSEEVKGPTKEELRALLEEADFETVTRATPDDICQQLGAQFKVDMRDREEEVKQIKDDLINNVLLEAIDFEK